MSGFVSAWRLRALAIGVTAITGTLVARIVDVQIIRHEHYITKANKQQHYEAPIRARRGNVFDRAGVPLAVAHWTYTVGVTPKVFNWKNEKAVELLTDLCNCSRRELRRRMQRDRTYVQLARDLHLTDDQVAVLSTDAGIRLDPSRDRLYPFCALPPQLLGTVDCDGRGIGGVEAAYEHLLGGKDGWLLVSNLPGTNDHVPANAPGEKPRNGADLYLTIDTRIQAIVDFELECSLERYGAVGGVAIVIDPRTGDILAVAEKPIREMSTDTRRPDGFALRAINCIYEPGSAFKLMTDSYLLENGRVDPYDVFFGENGRAVFPFGPFTDDEEHGWLTFKESFVMSSNICTIKALLSSHPDSIDFFRYLTSFGFGQRTGIALPAESRGTLRDPQGRFPWSRRSLPSIAIGYEVGVTAIQMALAYGALANGGELMMPRLALEARDERGRRVASFPALAVRRVFSEGTAETIREFCREVVLKGTATGANVAGIAVGGKTGTSRKLIDGRYSQEKYMVSFIGLAPIEDPRIVCLVILDEPACPSYCYGGLSAAIVFKQIVESVNSATDLFFGGEAGVVAGKTEPPRRPVAPSFLRLTRAEALDLADARGLAVRFSGNDGVVYSQSPDPGTIMGHSEEIRLSLRSGELPAAGATIPDLTGLPLREARRLLLACGLDCVVRGFGTVERQEPSPGSPVSGRETVTVWCAPRSAAAGGAPQGEGAR